MIESKESGIFVKSFLLLSSLVGSVFAIGGLPWAAVLVLTLALRYFARSDSQSLMLCAPCLFWLALSKITGFRELFFPYSICLATFLALSISDRSFWQGFLGGSMIVASFISIRSLQQATTRVLAIEIAVAEAILLLAVVFHFASRRDTASRGYTIAVASLVACSSLSI